MPAIGPAKAIKRMFVVACREGLKSSNLQANDPAIRKAVGNVLVEYPVERKQYPSIWVTSSFSSMEWQDINSYYVSDEGFKFKRGHFEATVNYEVLALSNEERDALADGLVNMVMFGHVESDSNQFRQAIIDEEYLDVTPALARLVVGPEGVTVGTPWDPGQLAYTRQVSFPVYGEFYQRLDNRSLVPLRAIDVQAA